MTVYRTSDLGWTAGQSAATTRSLLSSLLAGSFLSGDELALDAMYNVSGGTPFVFPDDSTLSAVKNGGLAHTGVTGGGQSSQANLLHFQNGGCKIRNVTFDCPNAPAASGYTGGNIVQGTNVGNIKLIRVDGDDTLFEYCHFQGNASIYIDVYDALRFNVFRTRFTEGGQYQIRLLGSTYDPTFDWCVFHGSLSDGIKTGEQGDASTTRGVKGAVITNTIFEDNWRDGIDTTGGFQNALVRGCKFRRNKVSGLDLKTTNEVGDTTSDLNLNNLNQNITIEDTEFSDNVSMVVLTLNDRAQILSASPASPWYAPLWSPAYLRLINCVVERNAAYTGICRTFLFKGCHSIRTDLFNNWNDAAGTPQLQVLGSVSPYGFDTPIGTTQAVLNELHYNLVIATTTGSARGQSTTLFSPLGPQDNIPVPSNPEINVRCISINSATGVLSVNTDITAPADITGLNVKYTSPGGDAERMFDVIVNP